MTTDYPANHTQLNLRRAHILVTGIQHSSTTWVGKTLSVGSKTGYVYEPFNIGTQLKSPFTNWYEYVTPSHPKEKEIKEYLNQFLNFSPLGLLKTVGSHLKYPVEMMRLMRTNGNLVLGKRQILKDPIAVLSTKWLAENFDLYPVVLIRHPMAFCLSFQKRGHHFPFQDFLNQDALMEDYLWPYEAEIRAQAQKPSPSYEQAQLLWKCIYTVVKDQQENHPDWIFLKNEVLSLNPEAEYAKLLETLHLPLEEKVKQEIMKSSKATDESWRIRNSQANAFAWKKKTTPEKISQLREYMGEIGAYFYGEDDWW